MFGRSLLKNEMADLQPNEPVSAPPITGPIDGPTYFKIRKDCIGKHFQVFQLTKGPSMKSP